MKSVVILMSGGVDSSVAAYLLKKQGYNVIGVTLKFWECKSLSENQKQKCCSPQDVYDAKNICSLLGIKHFVLDIGKDFEQIVINYFCNEYMNGFTPNPCIVCNKEIKFGLIYEKIKNMFDIDKIATGHYANILQNGNKYFISMAKDKIKDQSYFLSMIGNDNLKNFLFPLGNTTKKEVRDIAQDIGLKVAQKKDSYEICFIPNNDYREFLSEKGFKINDTGFVVEKTSKKIVGQHLGYTNYTIGQRAGLKLKKTNKKKYVIEIDSEKNIIYVGDEKDLYKKRLIATDVIVYDNLLFDSQIKDGKDTSKKFYGKIRYKSILSECKIKLIDDKMVINFTDSQRAITPGQYVVVYDDEEKIICAGKILQSIE